MPDPFALAPLPVCQCVGEGRGQLRQALHKGLASTVGVAAVKAANPQMHEDRASHRHSRSLDTRPGIYELVQGVVEERIPGVCLGHGGGFGRLSDGQELLGYWNP